MKVNGLDCLRRFLEHRRLPVILGLGAVLLMLPALKTGLVADDLIQRSVELKPNQLPPRMYETGIPADSGDLSTVLCDLFGFSRDPQCMARAKNYGVLPWWVLENLKAALWRPFTAFTHWLDYRLFLDSPMWMHAHNIAWFAAILFLATITYRRLIDEAWVAGLAAVLFLLDANTYFPVMFVANRGFMLALCFGLLCLHEHHRWRSRKSRVALILSMLSLALALLANEAGVSTFAFILAHAFVLEQTSFRTRALTVLPSVLVIIAWRTIYEALGYGLRNVGFGLYIDPAHEPLLFASQLVPRATSLLGGQLTGLPPDLLFALSPSLQSKVIAFYGVSVIAVLLVLLPLLRRNRIAAFWFAAMSLAAIPAATVIPLGKNLGFVAVGAFGLIAAFIGDLIRRQNWIWKSSFYRTLAWVTCVLLILAHVPGAIVGRVAAVKTAAFYFGTLTRLSDVGDSSNIENEDVVVVNAPCQFGLIIAPSYRAYHGQTLPKSLRTLSPGCTRLEITRTDAATLVIQSRVSDMLSCNDVGPVHVAYLFKTFNVFMGTPEFEKGERRALSGLDVEVLEVSRQGLPRKVAFRFDASLDSPEYRWLWYDWQTFSYRSFEVPAIGQSVLLRGPPKVSFSDALRAVLGKSHAVSSRVEKD